MALELVILAIILFCLLAGGGWYGWRWKTRQRALVWQAAAAVEAAVAAEPPLGGISINTGDAPVVRDRSGRIQLVLTGTFARSMGLRLLRLLDLCGLDGAIGSILLLEADERRRLVFLESVPAVFLDRIEAPSFPAAAGGWSNAGPQEVMEHIDIWGPVVIGGAQRAGERHQRVNRGNEAAIVLVFVSLGGSALLGTLAVRTIAEMFRLATFYASPRFRWRTACACA